MTAYNIPYPSDFKLFATLVINANTSHHITNPSDGTSVFTTFRFKYSIGAPVFEKVTVIWIYLNLNLLSEDEHPINRRIGRCLWEPRKRPTLSSSTWSVTGPWNLFQGSMWGSDESIQSSEALFVPLHSQENLWDVPFHLSRLLLWIYTPSGE